jgi:hypothetical protein
VRYFHWNEEKNRLLKNTRGLGFNDILYYLENNIILDIIEHPNKNKYCNQKMFILKINEYCYLVPFIEDNEICFLKTIIPSRKATRKYLGKGD